MREIKFRVWDNQNAKWAKEPDVIDSLGLVFGINDYWLEEGDHKCIRWSFMQYTGLKDKNGKDVFEGDIFIVNANDDEWYSIVEWRNELARFEFNTFRKYVTDVSFSEAVTYNDAYIAGNIFEHSHLLKQ